MTQNRYARVTIAGSPVAVDLLRNQPIYAYSQRKMVASANIYPPIHQTQVTTSSAQYEVQPIIGNTPDWLSNEYDFWWVGWIASNAATYPVEADAPNSYKLRAAIKFADETAVRPITFGGLTEVTVTAGSAVKCDTIKRLVPAGRTQYTILTYTDVAVNDFRPNGYIAGKPMGGYTYTTDQQIPGGLRTSSQASALAALAGGTYTANANAYCAGPAAAVANGWDGRAVMLCVGDSILWLDNGQSWITRGLEDTTSGRKRLPLWNLGVQGTRASQQSTLTTGEYKRRRELVQAIQDSQPSSAAAALPFTHVLSEMGVNDDGSIVTAMPVWWSFLAAQFPGCPIIQTALTPKSSSTNGWADAAGQTPVTGDRWTFNDSLPTHKAAGRILDFIDAGAAWCDSGNRQKWRTDDPSGTLTADYAANATTLVMSAAPKVGDQLTINPSGGTLEISGTQILAVTGSGPYTVTLGQAFTSAHSTGETVKVPPSRDGIHPAIRRQDDAAPLVSAKLAAIGLK